jgi:hypothetical protein
MWCLTQPTYELAWDACERGDWLLWLTARLCDRKTVVLAACACARTALRHIPTDDERPRTAIETAEAWCRGEATAEQVMAIDISSEYVSAATDAAYAAVTYAISAVLDDHINYAGNAASALREMAVLVRSMIPRPDLSP